MKMWKQTSIRILGIVVTLGLFMSPDLSLSVMAQPTHTSPNYGVDEVFFGAGGVNDANSANFNARASLGDLGVGNTASANFQAFGGFTTTDEPFLEMIVNAQSVDLGVLTDTSASTGTATFRIRAWLADGYQIITASDPPVNNTYNLSNLTTPTASSPGTEQFGINLVANTSPTNVGADPLQLPDATFSFGQAATDYNTANQYKYVKGDTIALSNQSTSITEYTITYLMNVDTVTPGGTYVMDHNLVAVARY